MNMKLFKGILVSAMVGVLSISVTAHAENHENYTKKTPLTPTYSPADSIPELGIFIAPSGEWYKPITPERLALHEANHSYTPLVTAVIPPIFEPPVLDSVDDYAMKKKDLVVINPAPEEFLWVMEGKRKGFNNLTIVMTNTQPGNGAPLHTHVSEEAHVLLEGKMAYFLGNERFVIEAPYIIHIPAMVPHAFMNVDNKPVKLVGVFPNNEWGYDVLQADPFAGFDPKSGNNKDDSWYEKAHREDRLKKYGDDVKNDQYRLIKHSELGNNKVN